MPLRNVIVCEQRFRVGPGWLPWGGIHDEQDALLSVADNSAQAASGPEIITFTRYMRIFS